MVASRLLCVVKTRRPGHPCRHMSRSAEVGNTFGFGPVAHIFGPKLVDLATNLFSFPGARGSEKKWNFDKFGQNMKEIPDRPCIPRAISTGSSRPKKSCVLLGKVICFSGRDKNGDSKHVRNVEKTFCFSPIISKTIERPCVSCF